MAPTRASASSRTRIIESQQREIEEMKVLIADLERK
jgi:hypothetical protein